MTKPMQELREAQTAAYPVSIPFNGAKLSGDLEIPQDAYAVVLFAHGSGSSRFSPRNRYVAQALRDGGLGTLLMAVADA